MYWSCFRKSSRPNKHAKQPRLIDCVNDVQILRQRVLQLTYLRMRKLEEYQHRNHLKIRMLEARSNLRLTSKSPRSTETDIAPCPQQTPDTSNNQSLPSPKTQPKSPDHHHPNIPPRSCDSKSKTSLTQLCRAFLQPSMPAKPSPPP